MANSGGGNILVGVFNDGEASGADVSALLTIDMADVINKIRGFTDVNFSGLTIQPLTYRGIRVAEIIVGNSPMPLVFGKSGNYHDEKGKAQCAFHQGMLYVRHGPKSEPATSDDLRTIIDAHVTTQRAHLLANLRQVIEAPSDSIVRVVAAATDSERKGSDGAPVRIVDSSDAKDAVLLDLNTVHPHRQKEVVDAVVARFAGKIRFTTTDNAAIRKLHQIDGQKKFYYKPKTGSGQYSEVYVKWVVDQIEADTNFLTGIRQKYHDLLIGTNQQRKAQRR